ncbi:hypothetical protein VNO78_14037 [Psophocarpus tetragonolobus]|uniref:Uncharacterized protein n=1 Tax=Psophocarpus tetragonolobus TaxID=3891 RepID=A0AAN9XQU4_PSOTE
MWLPCHCKLKFKNMSIVIHLLSAHACGEDHERCFLIYVLSVSSRLHAPCSVSFSLCDICCDEDFPVYLYYLDE